MRSAAFSLPIVAVKDADEPGMLDFIGKLDRDRLRRLFLVHGAPERQNLMEAALEREGYRNILIPDHGESVQL